MENIRVVPGPNAVASVDGEDIPEGPAPDYPEATDVRESTSAGDSVSLLLETDAGDA